MDIICRIFGVIIIGASVTATYLGATDDIVNTYTKLSAFCSGVALVAGFYFLID